jgi:hypothetical protein
VGRDYVEAGQLNFLFSRKCECPLASLTRIGLATRGMARDFGIIGGLNRSKRYAYRGPGPYLSEDENDEDPHLSDEEPDQSLA